MSRSPTDVFGALSREETQRWRRALEAEMAAQRREHGEEVAIWPAEAQASYRDLAQTWFQLSLRLDELADGNAPSKG